MAYINTEDFRNHLFRYRPTLEKIVEELKTFPSIPDDEIVFKPASDPPDTPRRVQVSLDNGWLITAYYDDGVWYPVPGDYDHCPIGQGRYDYINVLEYRELPDTCN